MGHNFGISLPPPSRLPKELINHNMVHFTNYPDDDLSLHILRLIGLHLFDMNDEIKLRIICSLNKELGIIL